MKGEKGKAGDSLRGTGRLCFAKGQSSGAIDCGWDLYLKENLFSSEMKSGFPE